MLESNNIPPETTEPASSQWLLVWQIQNRHKVLFAESVLHECLAGQYGHCLTQGFGRRSEQFSAGGQS